VKKSNQQPVGVLLHHGAGCREQPFRLDYQVYLMQQVFLQDPDVVKPMLKTLVGLNAV